MLVELAWLASLLIFLPLVGACVPGLAHGGRWWAMVGACLVAETDEEATDERPCHLPAWGEPPFEITWLRFNLPSSTPLNFDPFLWYSTQV